VLTAISIFWFNKQLGFPKAEERQFCGLHIFSYLAKYNILTYLLLAHFSTGLYKMSILEGEKWEFLGPEPRSSFLGPGTGSMFPRFSPGTPSRAPG